MKGEIVSVFKITLALLYFFHSEAVMVEPVDERVRTPPT